MSTTTLTFSVKATGNTYEFANIPTTLKGSELKTRVRDKCGFIVTRLVIEALEYEIGDGDTLGGKDLADNDVIVATTTIRYTPPNPAAPAPVRRVQQSISLRLEINGKNYSLNNIQKSITGRELKTIVKDHTNEQPSRLVSVTFNSEILDGKTLQEQCIGDGDSIKAFCSSSRGPPAPITPQPSAQVVPVSQQNNVPSVVMVSNPEMKIGIRGSAATVSNDPVARLMYYFKTVCSIIPALKEDSDFRRLTEYTNYRSLSIIQKATLFRIVGILSPVVLDDSIMVVPKNDPLLGGYSNKFVDISESRNLIGGVRRGENLVVFEGMTHKATKFLFCSVEWLEKNYITPMRSLRLL